MNDNDQRPVGRSRFLSPLAVILVAGLAVRLILAPTLSFNIDLAYWVKITEMIGSGFGLYDVTGYYYTPIWGYIVATSSVLGELLGITDIATVVPEFAKYVSTDYPVAPYVVSPAYAVMMKIPLIIGDTAVAFMLYSLVKDVTSDDRKALLAFGLWYLCPLVIIESSVHAMFDCLSALSILATVMILRKGNYFVAGVAFSIAVLTKFFPAYLIFFLVAYVLKREGIDTNGAKKVLLSVAGALVALFVVQIPAIMNGQFWESLFFLTDRVGISTAFLNSISNLKTLAILLVAFVIIASILYYLHRRMGGGMFDRIASMDPKVRDRKVVRALIALAIALTLFVIVFAVVSALSSDSESVMEIFTEIGMKFVMVLSFYTILLEMYLAYRFLYAESSDTRTVYTILFLSSVVIFLWPPLPQYVIVSVPFMIAYAVIVNDRLIKPFLLFAVLMTVYECVLGNVTALFPISVYTGLIPLDVILPIVEFLSTNVMGVPVVGFFVAIAGMASFISILGLLWAWYKTDREVLF